MVRSGTPRAERRGEEPIAPRCVAVPSGARGRGVSSPPVASRRSAAAGRSLTSALPGPFATSAPDLSPSACQVRGAGRANMKSDGGNARQTGRPPRRWWHRGPFVRREVRLSVGTLLVFLFVFYVALPLLASHRAEFSALAHVNVASLVLGLLLEIAALAAYTQLTHAVLPAGGPRRFRLFRINMSTLALSHVSPGGTGSGRGPLVPTGHPVGRVRIGRGLRARHPGDRLGGGAQRDVLVRAGGASSLRTASMFRQATTAASLSRPRSWSSSWPRSASSCSVPSAGSSTC